MDNSLGVKEVQPLKNLFYKACDQRLGKWLIFRYLKQEGSALEVLKDYEGVVLVLEAVDVSHNIGVIHHPQHLHLLAHRFEFVFREPYHFDCDSLTVLEVQGLEDLAIGASAQPLSDPIGTYDLWPATHFHTFQMSQIVELQPLDSFQNILYSIRTNQLSPRQLHSIHSSFDRLLQNTQNLSEEDFQRATQICKALNKDREAIANYREQIKDNLSSQKSEKQLSQKIRVFDLSIEQLYPYRQHTMQIIQEFSLHLNTLQLEHEYQKQPAHSRNTQPQSPVHILNSSFSHEQSNTDFISALKKQSIDPLADSRETWEPLKKKLQDYYSRHMIDFAYETVIELERTDCREKEVEQLMQRVRKQHKFLTFLQSKMEEQDWQLEKEYGQNSKLFFKHEEYGVGLKIQSTVGLNLQQFLSLICQIDLMHFYVPMCEQTKECRTLSRNQKIGYARISPPVIADRELYFYASGYNRLKFNNSLLFFSKTIHNDEQFCRQHGFRVPEKTSSVERLDYHYYAIKYQPTKPKAQVKIISCVDMKLNFLPEWVLKFGAKKFAVDYLEDMVKCLQKFQPWQKKIKQKPELYQFFQKQLLEHQK